MTPISKWNHNFRSCSKQITISVWRTTWTGSYCVMKGNFKWKPIKFSNKNMKQSSARSSDNKKNIKKQYVTWFCDCFQKSTSPPIYSNMAFWDLVQNRKAIFKGWWWWRNQYLQTILNFFSCKLWLSRIINLNVIPNADLLVITEQ